MLYDNGHLIRLNSSIGQCVSSSVLGPETCEKPADKSWYILSVQYVASDCFSNIVCYSWELDML